MTAHPSASFRVQTTDFLIIGSGIAGLRAAIELAPSGSVLVVNKGGPFESTTGFAQGGIAAAMEEGDSWRSHLEDTLTAGRGLCDPEAVEVLVREGPDRIRELIEWGARFDREKGRFILAREGGHRQARILRAGGDATGIEILRVLTERSAKLPSIVRLDHVFTVDLLTAEGTCIGAVFLKESEGPPLVVASRAVLLAAGGAGQVYRRTTNPPGATGDGMAIAYRAGALLSDMEFVQFHPTALSLPKAPSLLLTEAMRGEGARLVNEKGDAFMSRYHPDGELAPRDVVARAIWEETAKESVGHAYLDITHRTPEFVKERFPTIYRECLRYGLDITRHRIPVSPSAHFMMGGIRTSLDGATTLPGLFAAGEAAHCGIHGANRLASNSLLEGLVFGTRAARAMARKPPPAPDAARLNREVRDYYTKSPYFQTPSSQKADRDRTALRDLMWNRAGLVRGGPILKEALIQLEDWASAPVAGPCTRETVEFQNLLTVARLITEAALLREESRGVHFREDYPVPRSEWDGRHITFEKPDSVGYFRSTT